MPLTTIRTSNLDTTNSLFFRNRIINGDMRIDQRNDGASVTINNSGAFTYSLDRWNMYVSQNGKCTIQQNAGSVAPPAGFSNYLGLTSTSAYSVGSAELFDINQMIEGFNVADLAWGTANAKTITLSFWVRSSLTGTFGGALLNHGQNRSYPFSYTISAANTWEQKSITITGDTSGTWLTNNSRGIFLSFGVGVGSTLSGTAGSWSGNSYFSSTSATSVLGTNGATFYLTGVQLEVGTAATAFEYRPYTTELQLCQRYYQVIATGNAKGISMATYYTSTNLSGLINFAVTMRTDPTFSQVTGTNYYRGQGNGGTDEFNSFTADRASPQMLMWYNNSETSGTQGVGTVVYTNNNAAFLAVQAEL
jgi:hypothetical protein